MIRNKITPKIAIIDLGSNSFHMILAHVVGGTFKIVARYKQQVQLAMGLDSQNILSQDAIQQGVACLASFTQHLQHFAPDRIRVIGTYTLRQAINNQEFLNAAQKVFPFEINIISGLEEARLIYLGAASTQPETGRKLAIDIGGGSTEIILGCDDDLLLSASKNMGCASFARQFFPNDIINQENWNNAYNAALDIIKDMPQEYLALGWDSVLGSSGTISSAQSCVRMNIDVDGIITLERLEVLIKQVMRCKTNREIHIKGLLPNRRNVFLPGLAILKAIFVTFKIKRMRYSNGALREGVIASILRSI